MNEQCTLVKQFMFYDFELCPNDAEIIKHIFVQKMKMQLITIQMVQEILPSCWDFGDQARSGKPKSVYSNAIGQAIETNLGSSTVSVLGELAILESSGFRHFCNFTKSIWNCRIL